jgi:hypothetical protein
MRHRGYVLAISTALVSLTGPAMSAMLDQFIDPEIPGMAVEPGVTVTSRLRPDYDYRTVQIGDVVIRPEVSESLGYDSNVLGTSSGRGSAVLDTTGSLQIVDANSQHQIGLSTSFDDTQYLEQSNFSALNWNASLGGAWQLGRDTAFVGYTHQTLNQTPRDLDAPLLDRPVPYNIDDFRVGYDAAFNRLTLRPELDVQRLTFSNGSVNGQPYLQTFRDRTVIAPSLVAGYELAERRQLVLAVTDASALYDTTDTTGLRHNYNDVSVLAGIDDDLDGVIRIRALVGYETRNFASAAFKTIQAPIAEATLIYTPTGLTTVTATVTRRIADSSDETTTGYTETDAQVMVDHEYLRNVLLHGEVGVTDDIYPGGGTQTLYEAGAGVTWLLNRNMRLSLTDTLTARRSREFGANSEIPGGLPFGGNYTDNVVFLKLSFGL